MSPLTAKTLGGRIAQAWQARFSTRSDFHRALQTRPGQTKLAYPTITTWEKDEKVPKPAALQAIADVTGYTLDELYRSPPTPTEVEPEPGPLSDEKVHALLESLGISGSLRAAVLADLAAYPPRGGVHHEDVVRVVRLLSQRAGDDDENAAADKRLRDAGVKTVTREEFAAEEKLERAAEARSRAKKRKGRA